MAMDILAALSTLTLGLFAGSLLLEGLVLVPFWRNLPPQDFFKLHHDFGKRLFGYFAPLTTLAAILPLGFAALTLGQNWFGNVAALASLIVLLFFPLYSEGKQRICT
jgi:hypothetical protein